MKSNTWAETESAPPRMSLIKHCSTSNVAFEKRKDADILSALELLQKTVDAMGCRDMVAHCRLGKFVDVNLILLKSC